jgi:hypothetical protein
MSDYRTKHQYSLNLNSNLNSQIKQLSEIETILNVIDLVSSNDERQEAAIIKKSMFKIIESGQVDALIYWYELVNENSDEFFLHIDYDSSSCSSSQLSTDEAATKLKKHAYSPYKNSLNSCNSSNQLAAICFYSSCENKSTQNVINTFESGHKGVKINYLFKNDIFHVTDFEFLV